MMSVAETVRAWTDEDVRARLSPDAQAALPDNPAGSVDAELNQLFSAFNPAGQDHCPITTFSRNPCCG